MGVSGYTLGGGLSPTLGRSHGYAADHVRSLDVVTADGELRHVDAESEPDLFWALRGGKGNFGVVTALEFDLFPVSRLYGGGIYFPGERMADVLRAWTAWHPRTPETMVTSFAVMRMPSTARSARTAAREVPGVGADRLQRHGRGRRADDSAAAGGSSGSLGHRGGHAVHRGRVDPQRADRTGALLRTEHHAAGVPRARRRTSWSNSSARTPTPALAIAELRALGGAWDREPAVPNAVATRGLPYVLLGVAAGPLSEEQQLKESVAELLDGMEPWQGDRRLVNNLAPDEAADAAAIYGPERYERLASIKKTYDPANMFRLNHNVVPAA